MKNQNLKRADKINLLSSLIQGNPAPIIEHKQMQDEGKVIFLQATPSNNNDHVRRIMKDGQPMPDMTRTEFEQWKAELEQNGALVICIIRPERNEMSR